MRFDGNLARTPYDLETEPDGAWTREQLEAMDAHFTAALEAAFAAGLESRESARREVKLPVSPGPRWSTPLHPEIGLLQSAANWI